MSAIRDIPLRERKFAQTKLALLNAAISALETKPLEEISVKELCEKAVVSEGTFFNYFSKKSDILVYFIHLWSLEVIMKAEKNTGKSSALKIIEQIFELTGTRNLRGNLRTFDEIIAYFALMPVPFTEHVTELTLAEKLLAFPEADGIEDIPSGGLITVFMPYLEKALENGELPKDTDLTIVLVSLISIFFGTRMALRLRDPESVPAVYKSQLELLWEGVKNKYR